MPASESYVFDGVEVVKTGRTAVKKIPVIGGREPRAVTIVEIRPLDPDLDWKKWVDPTHLYVIQPPE